MARKRAKDILSYCIGAARNPRPFSVLNTGLRVGMNNLAATQAPWQMLS